MLGCRKNKAQGGEVMLDVAPARACGCLLSPCSLSPRGAAMAADDYPKQTIRLIVAVGGRRADRRPGAARRADPHRQVRPAGRGREPAGRGRRARRARGRKRAARRLHAADGQHQHARGDPGGVGQRGLRSGQGLRADHPDHRRLPDPGGASVVALEDASRTSSTTPRPIRARSTTRTPARAACRISPASCSCCAAAPSSPACRIAAAANPTPRC